MGKEQMNYSKAAEILKQYIQWKNLKSGSRYPNHVDEALNLAYETLQSLGANNIALVPKGNVIESEDRIKLKKIINYIKSEIEPL